MNLSETLALEGLRTQRPADLEKTIGLDALLKHVFNYARNEDRDLDMTRDEWAEKFAASKKFTLMEILTNRVASPGRKLMPGALTRIMSQGFSNPIVVDFNKNNLAAVSSINYVPKAVVIDGREKFSLLCSRGLTKTVAWVGNKVVDTIRADHNLSSDELQMELSDLLRAQSPSYPTQPSTLQVDSCWIEKVYPFENYFIYMNKDKRYRQHYTVDADKNVLFVGTPEEVELEYNTVSASSYPSGTINNILDRVHACGPSCGCSVTAAKNRAMKSCMKGSCLKFTKDGRTITLKDAIKIHSGISGGKRAKIRAVAPPGWEGTVKHMKSHPEISNPWALSWWMDKEGYKSHKENLSAESDKADSSSDDAKSHLRKAGFKLRGTDKATNSKHEVQHYGNEDGDHVVLSPSTGQWQHTDSETSKMTQGSRFELQDHLTSMQKNKELQKKQLQSKKPFGEKKS